MPWLKRDVVDLQPVVRTSHPYPLHMEEATQSSLPNCLAGNFRTVILSVAAQDTVQATQPYPLSVKFWESIRTVQVGTSAEITEITLPTLLSAVHRMQAITQTVRDEGNATLPVPVTAVYRFQVITHQTQDDPVTQVGLPVIISGEFKHV